jgi:hypothetical protein
LPGWSSILPALARDEERAMIGRRLVAAGVVAAAVTTGAVAGALIGIPGLSGASGSPAVSTQASETTTTTPDSGDHERGFHGARLGGDGVIAAAAKALNLSPDELFKKLSDGKTTIADLAQQENIPLSDVTDAMEAVAKSEISDIVNKPFPKFPDNGGHRGGRGGFGEGPMGGIGFGDLRASFDSLAQTLGLSPQDLMKDLAGGQSIADIAKSKNIDIDTVIKSLVDDATAKIDAAVKDGHLSQDQATKIESNLKDMITKLVNNGFKFGGFGEGFGHGGFPGPGGPGGFFPGGPSGATGSTGATTGPAPTA